MSSQLSARGKSLRELRRSCSWSGGSGGGGGWVTTCGRLRSRRVTTCGRLRSRRVTTCGRLRSRRVTKRIESWKKRRVVVQQPAAPSSRLPLAGSAVRSCLRG